MDKLNDLRDSIDRLDIVLAKLLNERARLVCEVAHLKKGQGIDIYQPNRERDVLRHVQVVGDQGLFGSNGISLIFERIVDVSRTLEREMSEGLKE